jgi:hypothetical protein
VTSTEGCAISSYQQGSRDAGSVGLRVARPFPLMGSLDKFHPGPFGSNCAGSRIAEGSEFHFHGSQRIGHVKLRFDPESADKSDQQADEQQKDDSNAHADPIPRPAPRIKEHKIRAAHKTTERPRPLRRLRYEMKSSRGDASHASLS